MTLERLLKLPPLESGDALSEPLRERLTRAEFERRYNAMPQVKKAELIEGIVYVSSPVRVIHSQSHAALMTWLGIYRAATPGVGASDNPTVRLDSDNEPQPDAVLRRESGGTSRISDDGYIEGAPELIAEIAASGASYDLHDKLRTYRRNGVQEYIVWRTYSREIDWFVLDADEYIPMPPNSNGVPCSQQFSDLWLAHKQLLANDLAAVLSTLQQGIATPEHQAFVAQLQPAAP